MYHHVNGKKANKKAEQERLHQLKETLQSQTRVQEFGAVLVSAKAEALLPLLD